MTYDYTDGEHGGNIYVSSHGNGGRAEAGTRLKYGIIWVSKDDGKTFVQTDPILFTSLNFSLAHPAVLSNGTVAVSIFDYQTNRGDFRSGGMLEQKRAWMVRSDEGGNTFPVPFYLSANSVTQEWDFLHWR